MLDPIFGEDLANTQYGFAPGLNVAVLAQIERHNPIIASAIRGNGHSAMAMIPRRRFDFELSGDDALPIDDEAEIITEAEAREMLEPWIRPDVREFRLLHDLVGPFWHLESPPPVRRSDWVMERAESYFTDQPDFHRLGVAPAGIRYRVWALANRILKEELARLGCGYVSVPAHCKGERGLLRPSYGRDATHGTQQFGEEMIQALEQAA